jgi:hypothetical protein
LHRIAPLTIGRESKLVAFRSIFLVRLGGGDPPVFVGRWPKRLRGFGARPSSVSCHQPAADPREFWRELVPSPRVQRGEDTVDIDDEDVLLRRDIDSVWEV